MAGKTVDVGSSDDYKFMDYAGASANANSLVNQQLTQALAGTQNMDPNAYMNMFMNQAGGLSNLVSGANAPLAQSLNALAAQSARAGGEQALAAMPGLGRSGAASAAFGQAYATPFAQAAAQNQQNQLQGTLGLWNNALGLNAQQQGNLMNYAGNSQSNLVNLANNQSAWYQPTYQYQKGAWDYGMDALSGAGNFMSGVGSLATGFGG